MGELALLVPSRGRPHNIARLVDAMDATCRGETRLVVGLDDDDPTLEAYQAFNGYELVVKPNLHRQLVRWLNLLATERTEDYRFIGHIGDDNVPRTDGWDVRIMESLERQGEIGFCYGDDLDPGRPAGSLSLTTFMTAEVVRRLGYMGPPQIQHMYVDPVWFAWGRATSIEFLPDVILEHLHWSVPGKAQMDESYQLSTSLIPSDCTNYNEYCGDGMNADIAKLGGVPYSVEAMREFNRMLNIPPRWGEPVQ